MVPSPSPVWRQSSGHAPSELAGLSSSPSRHVRNSSRNLDADDKLSASIAPPAASTTTPSLSPSAAMQSSAISSLPTLGSVGVDTGPDIESRPHQHQHQHHPSPSPDPAIIPDLIVAGGRVGSTLETAPTSSNARPLPAAAAAPSSSSPPPPSLILEPGPARSDKSNNGAPPADDAVRLSSSSSSSRQHALPVSPVHLSSSVRLDPDNTPTTLPLGSACPPLPPSHALDRDNAFLDPTVDALPSPSPIIPLPPSVVGSVISIGSQSTPLPPSLPDAGVFAVSLSPSSPPLSSFQLPLSSDQAGNSALSTIQPVFAGLTTALGQLPPLPTDTPAALQTGLPHNSLPTQSSIPVLDTGRPVGTLSSSVPAPPAAPRRPVSLLSAALASAGVAPSKMLTQSRTITQPCPPSVPPAAYLQRSPPAPASAANPGPPHVLSNLQSPPPADGHCSIMRKSPGSRPDASSSTHSSSLPQPTASPSKSGSQSGQSRQRSKKSHPTHVNSADRPSQGSQHYVHVHRQNPGTSSTVGGPPKDLCCSLSSQRSHPEITISILDRQDNQEERLRYRGWRQGKPTWLRDHRGSQGLEQSSLTRALVNASRPRRPARLLPLGPRIDRSIEATIPDASSFSRSSRKSSATLGIFKQERDPAKPKRKDTLGRHHNDLDLPVLEEHEPLENVVIPDRKLPSAASRDSHSSHEKGKSFSVTWPSFPLFSPLLFSSPLPLSRRLLRIFAFAWGSICPAIMSSLGSLSIRSFRPIVAQTSRMNCYGLLICCISITSPA